MGFADLSSSEAVLAAISECERLGEDVFLSTHGFGPSRHVRLLHEDKTYPAKAVVGVAHGYQFPAEGPLAAADFTSGDSTINKLAQMGFTAQSVADISTPELFVVRGGSEEEVVDYAVENHVVATGWSELGDFSLLDDQALEREMDDVYGHVFVRDPFGVEGRPPHLQGDRARRLGHPSHHVARQARRWSRDRRLRASARQPRTCH